MLRVLIISALFAMAMCHDDSNESNDAVIQQGYCPDPSSNASVSACATPCPQGSNCTYENCSSGANCTGGQMCCQTDCGLKCVDPELKTVCDENDDCPAPLVCCEKVCVTLCKQKPPKKTEMHHGMKEMEHRKHF
ncbi:uncharacterized protein RB166_018067 isoform 2-T2 [Leptodactylus fuscus]